MVKKLGIFLLATCVSLSAAAETHTYSCGPSLTPTGYPWTLEFDVYRDHSQRVDMQLINTEESRFARNNQLLYTLVETSGVTPKLINKIKLRCGYVDTPNHNEQDLTSIISVPAKAWTCESWDDKTATCTAPD